LSDSILDPTMDAGTVYAPASSAQDGDHGVLPIFDVQRVQLRFDISADFVAAAVANNVLVLALSSGRLLRFDLDNAEDIDDIDLPKKPAEIGVIQKLFLDPSASHLIITTAQGENYYLHTQSRQPKALSRLRGVRIQCVAWNPSQPTASTREILVGASDGNVYETYIEPSNEFYRREEKYVKNVYHSTDGAIVGLWIDAGGIRPDLRRVLVTTPNKLLHFSGRSGRAGNDNSGSIYTKLFDTEAPTIHDHSKGSDAGYSTLAISPESLDAAPGGEPDFNRAFAALCGQGIFTGTLANPSSSDAGKTTFAEAKLLTKNRVLPQTRRNSNSATVSSIALTHHHVLSLVDGRVTAVNRLDESVVYDQTVLEPNQTGLGLYVDQKKNTYWLFTQREIFEIVVTDENRHIWKILLADGKFDLASKYASTAAQKDAVASASGDHLVDRGNFAEAAAVYGRSSKAFEEVALTLIDKGEQDALRKYLLVKLSNLKRNATMQRILVASWLVELFMAKLNSLDDTITANTGEVAEATTVAKVKDDLPAIRREFQEFVTKYKSDLDRKTVYELVSSHGREEELLYFADTINDYGYVLAYWVQRERWQEAMAVLKKQTTAEMFYQYSSVLMEHAPVELTEVMMRQGGLEAKKLVPTLLNYSKTVDVPLNQNQAVRYLQFCINQHHSTEPEVHNTLVSIYASHPSSDESALLSYLQTQSSNHEQNYDADFALRLCITHKRVQSCVHIYTTMSQFASAVDMALKYDQVELAAQVADRSENDSALRKKLWLKVAKKVIGQNKGIKSAMDFLKRCELLRIEDLIPFFPDFIVIDDFKEEICEALEQYSRQIDDLRREMDESADTAQHIRDDIKALDQRYAIVEPGERCWICRLPLLARQFFVFPCQHAFHADCLTKTVMSMAGAGKGRRVKELQAEIGRGVVAGRKKERLIKELDSLVAGAW